MYKQLARYPDYEISEKGDIRRIDSKRIRKPSIVHGHKKITLKRNGKTEYIGNLVAETYISKPDEKVVVRHLDGNKENDHICNLEWVEKSVAQKDSYGLGIHSPGGNEPAKKIMINETGAIFPSIRSCARSIGGSPSGIRQCLQKKISSHKGFTFKLMP